jgi:hypothetical protein
VRIFKELSMKKRMRTAIPMVASIAAIAVLALCASCNMGFHPASGSITLSFAPPSGGDTPPGLLAAAAESLGDQSGKAISPLTASFRVTISAADIAAPITASGAYTPGQAISISVPAVPVGSARTVTVTALDAAGGSLTEGSVTMDVVAGANTASVSLIPVVAMDLPPGPDGLQNQAVPAGKTRFFKVQLPAAANYVISAEDPPVEKSMAKAFFSTISPYIALFDSEGKKASLGFNTFRQGYFSAAAGGTYYLMISTPASGPLTQAYWLTFDLDWAPAITSLVAGVQDINEALRVHFSNAPATSGLSATLMYTNVDGAPEGIPLSGSPTVAGTDLIYAAPSEGWPRTYNDVGYNISFTFTDAILGKPRILIPSYTNFADIHWVRSDGTGTGSRSDPFGTVYDAIGAATRSDLIIVAGGNYFSGGTLTLNNTITLLGGWDGVSTGSPVIAPKANITSLSYDGTEVYVPILLISDSAIVKGFTIAYAEGTSYTVAGGDFGTVYVSGGAPQILENVINAPSIILDAVDVATSTNVAAIIIDPTGIATPAIAKNIINQGLSGAPRLRSVENQNCIVSGISCYNDAYPSIFNNVICSGLFDQQITSTANAISTTIFAGGSINPGYIRIISNTLVSQPISNSMGIDGWGSNAAFYCTAVPLGSSYFNFYNNILYAEGNVGLLTGNDYAITFISTFNSFHTNNYLSGFFNQSDGGTGTYHYRIGAAAYLDASEQSGPLAFETTPAYCPASGSAALSMGLDPDSLYVPYYYGDTSTDIRGTVRTAPFAAGAYELQ